MRVVKLRNVVSALLDEEVIGSEKSSERTEDNLQSIEFSQPSSWVGDSNQTYGVSTTESEERSRRSKDL